MNIEYVVDKEGEREQRSMNTHEQPVLLLWEAPAKRTQQQISGERYMASIYHLNGRTTRMYSSIMRVVELL